jgi:hypothetical protein
VKVTLTAIWEAGCGEQDVDGSHLGSRISPEWMLLRPHQESRERAPTLRKEQMGHGRSESLEEDTCGTPVDIGRWMDLRSRASG